MRLLVVLVVVVATARANADPATERAKQLVETAMRRIADANDYAGASDLFLEAYELTKDPPYLFNVAVAQRKARLPHQAVATYRRYLAEVGDRITPAVRDQVTADIEHITAESAQVSIRTAGDPAEIELDQRAVGVASRAAPLVVLVSTEGGLLHAVSANRAGQQRAGRSLGELRPGQTLEIELEPTAIPTTGRVTIASDPPAAQLAIAGRGNLGLAPQTIDLPAGDYDLEARLPSYEPHRERVHVRIGEPQRVTVWLHKVAPTWWRQHRWQVAAAGAIIAGVGIAFGVRELLEPDYGLVYRY
jgi:hypothetical protein